MTARTGTKEKRDDLDRPKYGLKYSIKPAVDSISPRIRLTDLKKVTSGLCMFLAEPVSGWMASSL